MNDGFTMVMIIFGGAYCVVWKSTFPTLVERISSRIWSLITIGILPPVYAVLLADFYFRKLGHVQMFFPALEIFVAVGCFIARLYLLEGSFLAVSPFVAECICDSSEVAGVSSTSVESHDCALI